MATTRKLSEKEVLARWDAYRKNIEKETEVPFETEADKAARIIRLKGNFEEFCKFYFPNYFTAEFAAFHRRIAKKIIGNDNIYACVEMAREHAKSVLQGLFIPMYLKFTGGMNNMLLVSHSYDNACELLIPIMVNLESNQRILNDYGKQKSYRGWEIGRLLTDDGCSFRAIGAGQSPRGTRNEEKRPDFILIDDIDTDEEARNQGRIDRKWQWIEQALFPAMSISGKKRFIVTGNKISRESIIAKAAKIADYHEQINILDKTGAPSWKERYTIEQVNYMLSKISYISAQKEYFNNPISEGMVFKDITWGKVPPLSSFKFLCSYCDPSYKQSRNNDYKAVALVGQHNGNFYIIKAYLEQTTTAEMIRWHYDIDEHVGQKSQVYFYMEEVFMQDIFFEEFRKAGKAKGKYIAIAGDARSKPDKFSRIEANLEPLNRTGRLIFNEAEKNNPHMLRLEEQFKAIEPSLPAHDDGPDAVEGAVWMINNKLSVLSPLKVGTFRRNKYKY